jgi:tRNA threonylcarbamoyladenosine biosynthesis protein TsaB
VYQPGSTLAGNVFAAYGTRLRESGSGAHAQTPRVTALPTASAMLRLAPALLAAGAAVRADQALPLYIRDKVAKTTVERAAEKAALAT